MLPLLTFKMQIKEGFIVEKNVNLFLGGGGVKNRWGVEPNINKLGKPSKFK